MHGVLKYIYLKIPFTFKNPVFLNNEIENRYKRNLENKFFLFENVPDLNIKDSKNKIVKGGGYSTSENASQYEIGGSIEIWHRSFNYPQPLFLDTSTGFRFCRLK